MSSAHILVVDDELDIRTLVQEILEDEGYRVDIAGDSIEARSALREFRPDLILLDIWMPGVDGIELLREWAGADELPCPVIMISGHGNVETAVEATRLGAYDFLEKPLSMAKLLLTVQRALEADQLSKENAGLRQLTDYTQDPTGNSPALSKLQEDARRIAQHDTWVLLTGEPGSGRETYARFIHNHSARSERPFVNVGVGSIAKENSAVELFGSETGDNVNYGRLEQANGGTLFLDEISDMHLDTQRKLYSALESGHFLRVGGKEPVKVDVRVIAATQRDLAEEVSAGRFREDLYYRLNVVPLEILPLRKHREDVPELLDYYIDQYSSSGRLESRRFSADAQQVLLNHEWPGNIRELKNLVQRVLILGGDADVSEDEVYTALGKAPAASPEPTELAVALDLPLREAREQFEKVYLEYKLKDSGGNVGQMAKQAGMERTHVYRKLRALGIEIKDKR